MHQKNGVTFLPILLHVVFVENMSLLAIWMGRGNSGCGGGGGMHVLTWEEKRYLSEMIRVRVGA